MVASRVDNTFPTLSAALASISGNSASSPYVVKIAPGTYTETATVELQDYVDVEGSGQGVTTITWPACTGPSFSGSGSMIVSHDNITAEIRDITIDNSGDNTATGQRAGVYSQDAELSMTDVTVDVTGDSEDQWGVFNEGGSASMNRVTVTVTTTGPGIAIAVGNRVSSVVTMNNVTATATSEAGTQFGINNWARTSR